MPTSDHPVLDAIVSLERGIGDFFSHHRTIEDFLMSKVQELSDALKTLVPRYQDTVAKLAATEADRDSLKSQLATAEATIADNESTAGSDLDIVNALGAAETAASTAASPVVTTASSGATVTVVPSTATDPVTSPDGTVTQPGTVTHVDPTSPVVTTVDTSTGVTTAVNTSTTPPTAVTPDPAAVAEATAAAASAGVTVGSGSDSISGGLGNDMVHADPTLAQ